MEWAKKRCRYRSASSASWWPSSVDVGSRKVRPRAQLVDHAVPQKQLREPLPSAHQIAARVLTGTHQITGRLLVQLKDAYRHKLAQTQKPRQSLRVSAVCLARSPDARRIFDGAATVQAIPAASQASAIPYPVGPAS